MYQIKSNRTSNHIAGLDEATKASTDGMTYSQSACGALSRNLYLLDGESNDNLAIILASARDDANANGRKLCKNCEKAALRILTQLAQDNAEAILTAIQQDEAAEASQDIPVVTQKIAIIKDRSGNERVHAAGCADVAKEATKFRYEPFVADFATREAVARDWYGDVASDNYEAGTSEWEQEIMECMDGAMKFLPCCQLPSEAEAVEEDAIVKKITTHVGSPRAGKRYGKAQARVLAYFATRVGQTVTVSQIVRDLNEAGEKTWFNATNTALKALASDPTSGITEVEGGNKAYRFQ